MSTLRRATALILTRGEPPDLEVYLVERAPELKFFGGYLAFPGGVLEEADETAGMGSEDRALEQCAVRELFEETGVLPPALRDRRPADPLNSLRRELLAGERDGWLAFTGGVALGGDLRRVCRITTPPFSPVRYETTFFQLHVAADCTPAIWPGELLRGFFCKPAHSLGEWRAGKALIVPPVLLLLELMLAEGGAAFRERAAAEARALEGGKLHPIRFSPGVFVAPLATHTKPPATTTNTLLVGEQRIYVVDPGSEDEGELNRLSAQLEVASARGARLEGVLLTHHHPDHCGGAHEVCERHRLPLFAHAETLRRLTRRPTGVRPIGDGDRFELGTAPDGSTGWELAAIHTPGHSADHMSFQENRYHALIAGDLLSSLSTIVIDPAEGQMTTYLKSLELLLARPLGTIYPGHGPAVRDGRALIERTIAHRRARELKLINALGDQPRQPGELLPLVYDDVDPGLFELAEKSLRAGLIKLAEEGIALCTERGWTRRAVL